MLICPQCQFENPDTNNFCQQCGTSLIEKVCPACDAVVAFDSENCPHCGAKTGTVWRAIISGTTAAQIDQPARVTTVGETVTATQQFLDVQQRYLLLEPLPALSGSELETRVLDCNPLQPSLLDALQQQPVYSSGADSEAAIAATMVEQSAIAEVLPEIAQTYLALQQLNPSFPNIHDAWEHDNQTVVLLEDRSSLPLLLDLWSNDQVLPLQILHWLHETIGMWTALLPYHCTQSVLDPDNLRVDEDQLLCLQRLYFDAAEPPPNLCNLGRLWQTLFQKSQRTQFGALALLCHDLESGDIATLDDLHQRFEAIADELQSTTLSIDTDTMPDSSSLENQAADLDKTEPAPAVISSNKVPRAFQLPVVDSAQYQPVAKQNTSNTDEDALSEGDDSPTVVLPMRLVSLEDAGRTDIGRQRDHNEDYFSIHSDVQKFESPQGRKLHARGLYILCDGMGGHASGEVASALAVDTLKHYFETHWTDKLPEEAEIRDAIVQANKAIFDLNQQSARSGSGRMGTTLVIVLIQDTEAAIAHVGDSRLYRFSRRRGLEQVTVDHEVGQREIQRGVEPAIAYARPDAYQLTQALGPRDENFISPDIQFMELNEDLLLLLCSDGLTDNELLETHWRTHLEPLLSSQISLEQGVNQLVDLANHYNGHDNITTVAIRTRVRPNLDGLKA